MERGSNRKRIAQKEVISRRGGGVFRLLCEGVRPSSEKKGGGEQKARASQTRG